MVSDDSKVNGYTYRYYLVAHLDILGQRERLQEIGFLPRDDEEFERFVEWARGTPT